MNHAGSLLSYVHAEWYVMVLRKIKNRARHVQRGLTLLRIGSFSGEAAHHWRAPLMGCYKQ